MCTPRATSSLPCTAAFAVVGPETQPTEKRGSIGEVRPSGWQMAKYDFKFLCCEDCWDIVFS